MRRLRLGPEALDVDVRDNGRPATLPTEGGVLEPMVLAVLPEVGRFGPFIALPTAATGSTRMPSASASRTSWVRS
jgi:hypothetical protein